MHGECEDPGHAWSSREPCGPMVPLGPGPRTCYGTHSPGGRHLLSALMVRGREASGDLEHPPQILFNPDDTILACMAASKALWRWSLEEPDLACKRFNTKHQDLWSVANAFLKSLNSNRVAIQRFHNVEKNLQKYIPAFEPDWDQSIDSIGRAIEQWTNLFDSTFRDDLNFIGPARAVTPPVADKTGRRRSTLLSSYQARIDEKDARRKAHILEEVTGRSSNESRERTTRFNKQQERREKIHHRQSIAYEPDLQSGSDQSLRTAQSSPRATRTSPAPQASPPRPVMSGALPTTSPSADPHRDLLRLRE